MACTTSHRLDGVTLSFSLCVQLLEQGSTLVLFALLILQRKTGPPRQPRHEFFGYDDEQSRLNTLLLPHTQLLLEVGFLGLQIIELCLNSPVKDRRMRTKPDSESEMAASSSCKVMLTSGFVAAKLDAECRCSLTRCRWNSIVRTTDAVSRNFSKRCLLASTLSLHCAILYGNQQENE
ncbi:uncharacterized protein MONBRDRAFT_4950 [Monosiga brevicollis MX1]|uniref:Uncharacterized protein n=1 Tax=Monosiga brevicollis TaxID=81824 RepID=A9UPF8_MONBE|nr:uncharacterized protein MONBRDRAFT_4950 [Monosiga brevicollis MX1]EDQ92413.1 predicted protein [Monosiga brevicollis MX1]|eukprot:XP_001742175.1 hypothetical protein [Monosiga brevicollis MX1]